MAIVAQAATVAYVVGCAAIPYRHDVMGLCRPRATRADRVQGEHALAPRDMTPIIDMGTGDVGGHLAPVGRDVQRCVLGAVARGGDRAAARVIAWPAQALRAHALIGSGTGSGMTGARIGSPH